MANIGMYIDSDVCKNIDLSNIMNGNPGIGGTEYTYLALAFLLNKKGYSIHIYSKKQLTGIDPQINSHNSSNMMSALSEFDNSVGGIFIYSPNSIDELPKKELIKTKIVIWRHLDNLEYNFCKTISRSKDVKAVVFLTKEQRRQYVLFNKLLRKSTIIGHFANCVSFESISRDRTDYHNVTFVGYVGSKKKSVDNLLEAWPNVLKKVPDAHLYICGGNTYNKDDILGDKGIADPEYEQILFDIIKKYNMSNSISFLGNVNDYKRKELFKKTSVGVVRPSVNVLPETFCLSAIEFGANAIPCVAGDLGGLKNTLPKKCGYRIKNSKWLGNRIIKLLLNKKLNEKYGLRYYQFVNSHYNVSSFLDSWNSLIELVDNDSYPDNTIVFAPIHMIKCYCHIIKRMFIKLLNRLHSHETMNNL